MGTTKPLPEGTVTFLFTDIEGSTRLLQHLGEGYALVREEHRRLLREAFQTGEGQELGTEGDSFFVVFPTATGALAATVAAQRALAAHLWPEGAAVRVRMGLHTGTPTLTLGEYVGLDVHRAARISAAGHGGQILLSQSTRSLVEHDLPPGTSLRDLGAHRLKDLQHPEQLSQVVVAGLPADFPPLRSLEAVTHNLPIQLTRFIGREREMAEVADLLAGTRLVTLTGAGGSGKSRLALQVAAERVEDYKDGVWLVELAALPDPALVPQAVASVLGVREEPGRPLPATLTDFLRPKRLLLVLDNCEHLVEACARLAEELLRACPHLRILSTSREALGVRGETAWLVPSLSVPDPDRLSVAGEGPISALTGYEAARLFVDRAQLSQPRFAVTNENARTVAQVCQRLDGIPLAIELAAARVRVLSVEQIAARLDDRFRFLTGGSRTALPRHQTLRAAMDWSYELLSEAERVLLCRLSVFAGGWALAAAEAICSGDGIEESEVLDLLTRLVDRSLVLVEEGSGEARYRLLETIRQYGREKLQEAGEEATWRGRHRDWYLELVEQAEPKLKGSAQGAWLERLAREHDDLRAALACAVESGAEEAGLRLAAGLYRFWSVRGHLSEGREWMARLLALAGDVADGVVPAPAAARAKALSVAGVLAWHQGDYREARPLLEESLAIRRERNDRPGIASSLINLGLVAEYQGEYALARSLYEESLAIWREVGERYGVANALTNLGNVALNQGDAAAARVLHEESLVIWRELGEQYHVASALTNLGQVALDQDDDATAEALHQESLALRRELGDTRGIATSLVSLGEVAHYQGNYAGARSLYEESLPAWRELGDKVGIASSLTNLGNVTLDQGDHALARAFHEQSLALWRELGDRWGMAASLEGLAGVADAEGQPARAAPLFAAAQALRDAIGGPPSPHERAHLERQMAVVRSRLGEKAFAELWAAGKAMPLDDAISVALQRTAPC